MLYIPGAKLLASSRPRLYFLAVGRKYPWVTYVALDTNLPVHYSDAKLLSHYPQIFYKCDLLGKEI